MSDPTPLRIDPDTVSEDEEVVLKDAGRKERKPRYRDKGLQVAPAHEASLENPHIQLPGGGETVTMPTEGGAGPSGRILGPSGKPAREVTWTGYIAWRKTKCPPYDYENSPQVAIVPETYPCDPYADEEMRRRRGLEEISHAIHEFVGEVAELGQLLIENGPAVFTEPARAKLIDECGGILFCGCWVLDAYGSNPINDSDGIELVRVTEESTLYQLAYILANGPEAHDRIARTLQSVIMRSMLEAQTLAGLLCNSYKKLRWQRRAQDVEQQVSRVIGVMLIVNQLLIIANSTVEAALRHNQTKLDARFPGKSGVGSSFLGNPVSVHHSCPKRCTDTGLRAIPSDVGRA